MALSVQSSQASVTAGGQWPLSLLEARLASRSSLKQQPSFQALHLQAGSPACPHHLKAWRWLSRAPVHSSAQEELSHQQRAFLAL